MGRQEQHGTSILAREYEEALAAVFSADDQAAVLRKRLAHSMRERRAQAYTGRDAAVVEASAALSRIAQAEVASASALSALQIKEAEVPQVEAHKQSSADDDRPPDIVLRALDQEAQAIVRSQQDAVERVRTVLVPAVEEAQAQERRRHALAQAQQQLTEAQAREARLADARREREEAIAQDRHAAEQSARLRARGRVRAIALCAVLAISVVVAIVLTT